VTGPGETLMTTDINPADINPAAREPGWYPDPLDRQLLRYWDTAGWTFWTAEVPPTATSAPEGASVPAPQRAAGLRDDIAAAQNAASNLLGAGKEIRLLERHLRPEERVVALTSALSGGWGVLACTNHRMLFLFSGLLTERFVEVDWNQAREISYDVSTKLFEVYTVRRTKRAMPALSVTVADKNDAIRVAEAARQASSAPRLDVI
jgi:hypothetical protein